MQEGLSHSNDKRMTNTSSARKKPPVRQTTNESTSRRQSTTTPRGSTLIQNGLSARSNSQRGSRNSALVQLGSNPEAAQPPLTVENTQSTQVQSTKRRASRTSSGPAGTGRGSISRNGRLSFSAADPDQDIQRASDDDAPMSMRKIMTTPTGGKLRQGTQRPSLGGSMEASQGKLALRGVGANPVDKESQKLRQAAEARLREQNEARCVGGIRLEKPSERRKRLASSGGNSPPPTPRTALLQQTSLFRGISRLVGSKLTAHLEERHVRAGTPIYSEGDVQNWLGVLESGHASVLANIGGVAGKPQRAKVGEVTALTVFGELCAFGFFEQRTSTLLALEDSVVFVLPGEMLWEVLAEHPDDEQNFVNKAKQWRSIYGAPMLQSCHPEIVYQLRMKMEVTIVEEGPICKKGDFGETTLFLESGRAVASDGTILEEGSVIDEGASLGVADTRADTITCSTECQIAALHRDLLWTYTSKFDSESGEFQRLVLQMIFGHEHDKETVGNCPLFTQCLGCPDEFLKEVRQKRKQVIAPPGTVLQEEGTTSDTLYIMIHGRATLSISGYEFSELTNNDFFGELSILNITSRRRVSIKAKTFCVLDSFRRSDVEKAAHRYQNVRLKFRDLSKLQSHFVLPPGTPNNAQLVDIPFFQGVSPDLLSDVSHHLEDRLYFPDQAIITKGEKSDFMVMLLEGNALVTTRTPGKKNAEEIQMFEAPLPNRQELKPISISGGSVFGEKALLGVTSERSATVTATSVCCVQVLHRQVLTRALRRHPDEKKHFDILALSEMENEDNSAKFSIYMLPLFKDCPSRFIYLLNLYLERRLCCKDETIVEEGTEGEEMFIICSGIADVEINGVKVGEFQEGTCFGEMAALGISNKRTATIRARMICDVRILHRHYLENAFGEFPEERFRFETLAALRMRKKAQTEVPFFQKCDPEFMMALSQEMEDKLYVSQQVMVNEGEMGDCMFILHKGQANVTVEGVHITIMEDGEVFGEIAVLGISKVRTATITAITDCFVQVLHRPRLVKVLKRFPHERQQFDMIAAKRIEERLYQDSVRELAFFRGSPRGFVEFLDTHLERRIFFAGDKIISEGDPAYHFFVLFSGCADVDMNGLALGEISAGEVFGEMSLFQLTEKRGATVRARDLCDTQVIAASKLFQGIALYPEQKQRFIDLATKRMRVNVEKINGPLLDKISVFEGCDELFLENIAMHLEDKLYFPGDCLCEEGEKGDSMFILTMGVADVELSGRGKVGQLKPGHILGEIVVLGLRPWRSATVRARDLCFVQVLRQDVLMKFLDIFTDELVRFQEIAAERLKQIPLSPLLKEQPLFQKSHPDFIEVLESKLERRFYFKKQHIFEEGADCNEIFILRHGRAAVEMYDCKFGEINPPSCFGELGMLGSTRKRMATVTSELLCDVQVLTQEAMEEALQTFPMEKAKMEHHLRLRKNLDKLRTGIRGIVRLQRQVTKYQKPLPKVGEDGAEWTLPVKPGENLPQYKMPEQQLNLGLQVTRGCIRTKVTELEDEIRVLKNDTEDKRKACLQMERDNAAMEIEIQETEDKAERLAWENQELLLNAHNLWKCIEELEVLKSQIESFSQLQSEAIAQSMKFETKRFETTLQNNSMQDFPDSSAFSKIPVTIENS